MNSALTTFEQVRPRLFGIAYRVLGSRAEAEDVVQETWLRWQGVDHTTVTDAGAFLSTATTRLALNVAQSAHARRSDYIGLWLPEPVDTTADPTLGAETSEALELAVLMLLEKLTPTERAAYVLREAFDDDYAEIAKVLEVSEANVRQLVSRARKHLADERKRPVSAEAAKKLLTSFVAAAQRGDRAELERLFAEGITTRADGNGIATASRVPVHGRAKVAAFVSAYSKTFWANTRLEEVASNGRPALLVWRHTTLVALLTVDASDDGIEQILWVMNPDKLKSFS